MKNHHDQTTNKKNYKLIVVASSLLLLASGIGYWLITGQGISLTGRAAEAVQANDDSDQVPLVKVFEVKQVAFRDDIKGLMGTISGSSIELKSTQEEQLIRYHVKPGSLVKRGQLIAELDHTRTKSRYQQAEFQYKRHRALYRVGGIARIDLAEAKAALMIAKQDYQDTFIRAPKNGYVGEQLIEEGELANRQSAITNFVSIEDGVFVETSIIERQVRLLDRGQSAKIRLTALPGEEILGQIVSISPQVSTTSRMAPVRIKLPAGYLKKLRPGLSAVCQVTIFDQSTLVIPKTAILEDQQQVLVVNDEQQVVARSVQLGHRTEDYIQITAGLVAGELVIVQPNFSQIKAGQTVRFKEPMCYPGEQKNYAGNEQASL